MIGTIDMGEKVTHVYQLGSWVQINKIKKIAGPLARCQISNNTTPLQVGEDGAYKISQVCPILIITSSFLDLKNIVEASNADFAIKNLEHLT